ncbi:MAG: thermonuclease family protein [Pseudomonadota bacterium]
MKFASILLSLLLAIPALASDQTSTYPVESIEDGDTILVNIAGSSERIQLSGIDAPEDTQNAKLKLDIQKRGLPKEELLEIGRLATSYLNSLIAEGESLSLKGDLSQRDKYGRIPAIVINEKGDSLNLLMVREGYATLLKRYPLEAGFKAALEEAEQHARSSKSGLWASHPGIMAKWSGR